MRIFVAPSRNSCTTRSRSPWSMPPCSWPGARIGVGMAGGGGVLRASWLAWRLGWGWGRRPARTATAVAVTAVAATAAAATAVAATALAATAVAATAHTHVSLLCTRRARAPVRARECACNAAAGACGCACGLAGVHAGVQSRGGDSETTASRHADATVVVGMDGRAEH
eukprot:354577-Chlamydomonas_euryale.AAC.1